MGKELAQQSADAGREPGGTAEAIAARGGDPAIAAFIGGGGASDSLNGATSAGAAEQPSSSADPESDGAARLDADAAGGEVGVAERVSPLDAETSGMLPKPS